MTKGVLLALLAYAVFAASDAVIKSLGGKMGPLEISFFVTLCSGVFLLAARPPGERWRDFWRTQRPWRVNARGLASAVGLIASVTAFTSIPLAEAYALMFLAPLFVTLLAVLFLKEDVGVWRWAAVAIGFAGVLLVVRPGFRELGIGHFASVASALLTAINITLIRSLSSSERTTTMLGTFVLYGLAASGVGMLFTGGSVPDLSLAGWLILCGAFAAAGQFMLLMATRFATANAIAPTHYSQMVWAVVFGSAFFGEYPDTLTLIGLAIVGSSGLVTLIREKIRLGRVRWSPFGRGRI